MPISTVDILAILFDLRDGEEDLDLYSNILFIFGVQSSTVPKFGWMIGGVFVYSYLRQLIDVDLCRFFVLLLLVLVVVFFIFILVPTLPLDLFTTTFVLITNAVLVIYNRIVSNGIDETILTTIFCDT